MKVFVAVLWTAVISGVIGFALGTMNPNQAREVRVIRAPDLSDPDRRAAMDRCKVIVEAWDRGDTGPAVATYGDEAAEWVDRCSLLVGWAGE